MGERKTFSFKIGKKSTKKNNKFGRRKRGRGEWR
jgi:hypothetical protein